MPIFADFVEKALQGAPATPFNLPTGMSEVWIDPTSGVKAYPGQAAIEEAFKPGTGPNLVTSVIGVIEGYTEFSPSAAAPDPARDITMGRGGLF